MKRHYLISLVVASLSTCLASVPARAAADPEIPSCFMDLICDTANLLSSEQRDWIETYHNTLLNRYDIDYRVLTGVSADGDTAATVFGMANVGGRSKSEKGLLLLINPAENLVRIEVSAGLDAVYTDGFVAYIQQRQMVPFFQANLVADGILATTEMIVTRAQEATAGREFIPPEQLPENLAIGAGAQTEASIGTGYQAPAGKTPTSADAVSTNMTPEQVVGAYHYSLENGITSPDLDIYSTATRELRKKWVVTPAQMKNELKAYKKCSIDKTHYIGTNELAVVRYKIDQRKCAPYFLIMEDGAWRIDFVTMMQNIRFNFDNDWHLDMSKPLPYADAFADWKFDKNGFPHAKPN